jgi:hypothetical protein
MLFIQDVAGIHNFDSARVSNGLVIPTESDFGYDYSQAPGRWPDTLASPQAEQALA